MAFVNARRKLAQVNSLSIAEVIPPYLPTYETSLLTSCHRDNTSQEGST